MSASQILTLYKELGDTPLQCLDKWRAAHPEYAKEKMSYLGRLDPMAEGLMLVAVGEENKDREKYLKLDKEYEFEMLFGFETDTDDVLGLATVRPLPNKYQNEDVLKEKLDAISSKLIGTFKRSYPPYSSRTVGGKPLWQWAREGKLNEITVPQNETKIYSLECLDVRKIPSTEVQIEIGRRISLVEGDFRQTEILAEWFKVFQEAKDEHCLVASFKVACSSGTYVRQIIHTIGDMLQSGAFAWKIRRTKAGEYSLTQ